MASHGPSLPSEGDMSAPAGGLDVTASESSLTTPPKVAETFVVVLVGCSHDWAAIYSEAAGHGRCSGGLEVVGCFCVRVEGGRDSRRLGLATCARAHERGFSCPS